MIVVGPWGQSSFGFQSLGGVVAKEHLRVRMKAHFFQLKASLGSVMLVYYWVYFLKAWASSFLHWARFT